MTYNVSGPDTYPSIEAAGRTADSPAGEMEGAVLIKQGQSPLEHPAKFTRRDPGPMGRLYGYIGPSDDQPLLDDGQYSPDFDVPLDGDNPDRYATWIAEITFDDDNEPGNGS